MAVELPTIVAGRAETPDEAFGMPRAVSNPEPATVHGWGGAAAAMITSPHAAGGGLSPIGISRRTSANSSTTVLSFSAGGVAAAAAGPNGPAMHAFKRGRIQKLIRGAAGGSVPVHMDPTPTELPCACCVSPLPSESFGVEVHQVGRYIVKGEQK